MKNKTTLLLFAGVTAVIGALFVIPVLGHANETEPESEWYPQCGCWDS